MNTELWTEILKGRDLLEELGDEGIILKCNLEKYGAKVKIGLTWVRIGTSGGLL
jgi:hypothetical protein